MADAIRAEVPTDGDLEKRKEWYKNPYQVIAMLSNFSTDYNIANISLVLPILSQIQEESNSAGTSACASSLLAGMVIGQLVGGGLGDSFLGRMGALKLVTILQIVGSVCSAALPQSTSSVFFFRLATCRFFLGIGAGGVYPLAAVLSAEQGKADEKGSQAQRVVLTFSMQGLGFMSVPLVACILLLATDNLDLVWRLLLGMGSIPGLILMYLHSRLHATSLSNFEDPLLDEHSSQSTDKTRTQTSAETSIERKSWKESILGEPDLWRKLIGTAGTWCLFDILFYGNTLFQPVVVKAAFGNAEYDNPVQSLQITAFHSLILTTIALPGYAVAGAVMGKRTGCVTQTPRYVMLQGFAAMCLLYLIIGTSWSYLGDHHALLLLSYGLTFFFSNYGPNTTTFILPSLVFSPPARSTFNGISAASGKLGALLGATLFSPAASAWGDAWVMIICAGLSLISFFLTLFFVPDDPASGSRLAEDPRSTTDSKRSLEQI